MLARDRAAADKNCMTTPGSAQDPRALMETAELLARAGRVAEAAETCRGVIRLQPSALPAHALLASLAFQAGRFQEATDALAKCVELSPLQADFAFRLGLAAEKAGNGQLALQAYLRAFRLSPRDARLALFAGAALEDAGRFEDAAVVFSLGDDLAANMRKLHRDQQADPDLRQRSAKADRRIREHYTQLHHDSVDEASRLLSAEGHAPHLDRVRNAIWPQTHLGSFDYRTPLQAPDIFYMPDLPASPTVARERLPWAAAVEACTEIVRREYEEATRAGAPMAPYVHAQTASPVWRELRGNMDWSSLHLYSRAEETPVAKLFPQTLRALEAADIVRVGNGKPIEMFFSRLAPGTHIPPHCGAANNRLTVHLPLIVPPNCAIRVANEVLGWRVGELLAFDDSFEHEAWNRSDSERVVLIFEAHHPDLRPEERRAIEHIFMARERWRQQRSIPSA